MKTALEAAGGQVKLIAPHLGFINATKGKLKVDQSFLTAASVVYDAVYVPAGEKSFSLLQTEPDAIHFIEEAYKHCKPIAAEGEGIDLVFLSAIGGKIDVTPQSHKVNTDNGVLFNRPAKDFIKAISQHRFWQRENAGKVGVPA